MSVGTNILSTNIDIWIIIQILSYFVAFFLMIKFRKNNLNKKKNINDLLLGFILISLIISSLLSSELLVSTAYTFLFFVGIFSYYYYEDIFNDLNEEKIIQIYKLIRIIFIFLLIIVVLLNLFSSGYVATESRISGGRVANVLVISPIVLFISIYLMLNGSKDFINIFCIILSATVIFFAYSRSTWWSTIFFSFLLMLKVLFLKDNNELKKLKQRSILYFTLFILIVVTLFFYSEIINFLTRGQKDPFSLSGRDLIAKWVFEQMKNNIFGLGLGTGFKRIFPTLIGYFEQYGLEAEHIGTAHNAYLSMLISGGWISFLSYILLSILPIIFFIKKFKLLIKSNFYLLFIIFLFLISNNMVNATAVMPSYLTFGLFWLILSLINICILKKIINENITNS